MHFPLVEQRGLQYCSNMNRLFESRKGSRELKKLFVADVMKISSSSYCFSQRSLTLEARFCGFGIWASVQIISTLKLSSIKHRMATHLLSASLSSRLCSSCFLLLSARCCSSPLRNPKGIKFDERYVRNSELINWLAKTELKPIKKAIRETSSH